MNSTDNQSADQRIDHLLHAFASTPAPAGLEQRIHALLEQRAATATSRRQPLFVLPFGLGPYAVACAAVALFAAAMLTVRLRTQPRQEAGYQFPAPTAPITRTIPAMTARSHASLATAHTAENSQTAAPPSAAREDLDATALTETLAPSHAAPESALTSQEALLVRSAQPGQAIELAELDAQRTAMLVARDVADDRERIRNYIRGILAPLAASERLHSTETADEPLPVARLESPSAK